MAINKVKESGVIFNKVLELSDGTQSKTYPKKQVEQLMNKCNTIAELDFVLKLKDLKKGTPMSEIVKLVSDNADIGLGRIQDLMEIAKNETLPENITNLVIDSELKSSKELSSTYGDSLTPDKTPEEKDALFQAEFQNFMEEFKSKFLKGYFEDIQTMEPAAAKEYLKQKFNPLAQAIVDQFDAQYGGQNVGLNIESTKKLNDERDRRYQIVTRTVLKTLGDFFQESLDKIAQETGKKKEEIVANIQGYNEWQSHYTESTEFITEMQENNKHVLEAATGTISMYGRTMARRSEPVLTERDDVGKKHKAVKTLHTEAGELSKLLESLWRLQSNLPDRHLGVNLAEPELAAEFPEEYKEYKRLLRSGGVPEARKKVQEAEAQHKAAKNTKKAPETLKTLNEARAALDAAKKAVAKFGEEMDKKGGFVGYLLTSCITQLEGFGLGDDTEASISTLDVEAIEKLTEKIKTLSGVLKEENQELFEKVAGKQPGEV